MATTATLSSSAVEPAQGAAQGQAKPESVSGQSFFAALTKWIPSEVIAVWLLVQAALGPIGVPPEGESVAKGVDFSSRWYALVALVAGAVLTVTLMYVGRSRELRKDWRTLERGWAFTILFAAPVSAAAWVLGLPDSPLYDYEWYSQAWGVVIVAVTATAIAALAFALGIRDPDYPVLVTEKQ